MKEKIIISLLVLCCLALGGYYFLRPTKITNYPSIGTDIVAFGDSLVEGVGSTPGNDFISVLSKQIGKPIINLGHSGDTTADGLARINDIDKFNPKVVIVLLGGNDYLKKIPLEQTNQNLVAIIKNIQARGAIVLLLGVRGGLIKDNFENEFENLHQTYHTAFVSDVLDGLFSHAEYMSDSVHPNDAGYATIANRVYKVLNKIIN